MSKYNISEELMARFYEGETTPSETMMILKAAKEDPELKAEIDIIMSIPAEMTDIRISKDDESSSAKIISIQPSFLPMMLKAAQNKAFATSDCVVRCEWEILRQYQPDVTFDSIQQLSSANGWIQAEGTALYNIGRLAEEYNLSVVRRYDCSIENIVREIKGHCHVIVVVNAEKLYGEDSDNKDPNHAIIVKKVDVDQVKVYDPQLQKEEIFFLPHFWEAWKDSQCYLVSVIERGLRQYDPQPIDVTDFPLDGDIKELIEAIAENCHDIWARERMDHGWTYGPERDDKNLKHPDLVPYSDLPDSEKKYDIKMAQGTLELIQRLGFKIKKE